MKFNLFLSNEFHTLIENPAKYNGELFSENWEEGNIISNILSNDGSLNKTAIKI